MRELVELASRVADLERRFSGLVRHGTVEEVDPEKQIVRLKFGEDKNGNPFMSPWVPYAQIAGALKVHTPPTKGQQMSTLSPSGDWMQAVALPMHWSDQNPSPSDKGDENVLTYGNVRATIKDNLTKVVVGACTIEETGQHLKVTLGNSTFEITGSQVAVTVGGVSHVISAEGVTINGGMVTHDGRNIGSTHKHTDVEPGPALTGLPV
jgi:phage baseplate assembly protein V